MYREEGMSALFKCVALLWMRRIPYTTMKFACFEKTVEIINKYVIPKPRADCSKSEQLVVTLAACLVSHLADTVDPKLNQEKNFLPIESTKRIGFIGLLKGLMPNIVIIGASTASQWFIYDFVKVTLALPRSSPSEMLASLKAKLAAEGKSK